MFMIFENFQEELCLTLAILLRFVFVIIYHVSLILIQSEGNWFGASKSLCLSIINNAKYVLDNKLKLMVGICRKDYGGIYSSISPFYDLITCTRVLIDVWMITDCIVMSLSLLMTAIIKQHWWNSSSNIFIIASASLILELPSKLFGKSFSSVSYPLLYISAQFFKHLNRVPYQ